MENEHWQGDERKFPFEPFVGADQGGNGQRRLNLLGDEWITVQCLQRGRIAREVLVLECEHGQVRRDAAQPLDDG